MPSTSSSYLIVPMSRQPAQVGVPSPSAPHPGAGRPSSRVSLWPPQQSLNAHTDLPQPSPPSAGRKVAASPKIQTLKSLPSQLSSSKRFVHKELLPAKDHSQVQSSDSVRSKFRETLAAAFSTDPDHQFGSVVGPSECMSQPNPKRAKMSDVHPGVKPVSQVGPESRRAITTDETKKARTHNKSQSLAIKTEEELFKLFGGVNKKYKEKGRSLLFNLKDRNNPALRERVLSGDITPTCLCAMTAEELASKELSEWRMAKAEELANMVVLPDRERDVGCLVRKTHKGEFQVEVEETDVVEDLPEIMTLDEFMQVLHSEPHPEDQSARAMQDDPSFDKADKALKSESFPIAKDKAAALKFQFHSDLRSAQDNFEAKLESSMKKSVSIMDSVLEPKGNVIVKSRPEKVDTKKPDTANGSIPESSMQCKITPDAALTHDRIWEATIQLSLTSLTSIVAIFKSGEKTSTAEWRRFLEIKGRVRLSVFKKFIEQLPNSRSRAIMVTELCLKEGSLESGRHHLLQTIDSYIADGRVGLVNPAEGVEIYLCPQGEAVKILADHLPKQHSSSLIVTETSIIGLVVWRRPHVSPKVLPNGQDVPKSRAMIPSSIVPRISQPPSRSSNACRSAHGLPGSGPGVVKDDDDDLPEHNLVSVSNSALNATTSRTDRSHRHASLSEYRAREMIRKYGTEPVAAQPWNGDGDEFASMRATVPVQRPLTYGHLMRPAQQSCYGVPDDIGYRSGSWNQGLMAWNPW